MKEKILKILHVIGYVATALLIVLGVAVGVQSCNNNDQTQTQPKAINNIVATYPNEQDRLFLTDEIIYNDAYCRYYFGIVNTSEDFEIIINYLMNKLDGNITIAFTSVGFLNNVSTDITSGVSINEIIYQHEGSIWEFRLNGSLRYQITYEDFDRPNYTTFKYYLRVQSGVFLTDDLTFKYFNELYRVIDNSTREPAKFLIPPYLTFDKDIENFRVNVGFIFDDNRYYAIEYSGGELYFVGETNLRLRKQYSLNGEQIFFSSGRDAYSDNIITFTSYGNCGLQWLLDNLMIENEYYYSGTYYLNEQAIVQYIRVYTLPQGGLTLNYYFPFYSNGEFFTSIQIAMLKMDNSNNVLVRVGYYNGALYETVILFKYYSLDSLTWETRETDVKQTQYYSINFDNVLLDTNNYVLFKTYYYLEKIELKINDDNAYVGNVFILIGDAFSSILPILSISILPGITLGMLIFVPFVITIVLFVVWLFKR